MNNQTVVFKLSPNLVNEVKEFYQDRYSLNKPPYSTFQARDYDCITTLYDSGKIMFQGLGADIEASYWIEQERIRNNRNVLSEIDKDKKKKESKKENLMLENEKYSNLKHVSTIGSDEVGCGDLFGPIIVTATYISKDDISKMYDLGIKDSKKLSDEKILEIGPKLEKEFKHVSLMYDCTKYNKDKYNMVQIKSLLHNQAICELKLKYNLSYSYIVIDEFVNARKYFEYVKNEKLIERNITFTPRAEDKCFAVAASSIISRYIFLKCIDKMQKELNMEIPLGANQKADIAAKNLFKTHDENELSKYIKMNFNNIEKIKTAKD